MDTKVIEVNKNVIVNIAIPNDSKFNFTINNIAFIPDAVIIKQVGYNPTINDPNMFIIYSDILSDNIAFIIQNTIFTYNNIFLLNRNINQTWKFSFRTSADANGIFFPNIVNGNIFIHLEFVKYKEVKEGKIY
jgi:tRNA U54 and U55 pseudouridine synthase Pus10